MTTGSGPDAPGPGSHDGFALDRRRFLRSAIGAAATGTTAGLLFTLMSRAEPGAPAGAAVQPGPADHVRPGVRQRLTVAVDPGDAEDAATSARSERPRRRSYGRLQRPRRPIYASSEPADRFWLALPEGFDYAAFGHTGERMSDGTRTPAAHDGMAAFPHASDPRKVWLVRNHELSPGERPAVRAAASYDAAASGGTTNLLFDLEERRLVEHFASVAGTTRNCAGGPTPWGTWLTCEETFDSGPSRRHGYVFEVPADRPAAHAKPLVEMGRFVHEAVAVDPATGIVYETEDRDGAGFYRFVPTTPGDLAAGGRLQMLAVRDRPRHDTRTGQRLARWLPVEWVDIDDPDPRGSDALAVFRQGVARGGATFGRLEGAWYGNGSVYIVSTSGGDAGKGQVWEYRPRSDGGRLRLVFESPGSELLDSPDNITVSPAGGLVLCEDGGGNDHLRGVTQAGDVFDFARNVRNTSELAGATFSPDGSALFCNIQDPGVTTAIFGPWERGPL